eukprot:1138227-Pelagomonas_calceolata.AAC.4
MAITPNDSLSRRVALGRVRGERRSSPHEHKFRSSLQQGLSLLRQSGLEPCRELIHSIRTSSQSTACGMG